MPALRAKSLLLTGYLEYLLETELPDEVSIFTPRNPSERGCQLSLTFKKDIDTIFHSLKEKGVVCDMRKPNIMRVAPTPLYNSFQDVLEFVQILKEVLSAM
jgi:kynureninase